VRSFLWLVRSGRCDRASAFFTTATQQSIAPGTTCGVTPFRRFTSYVPRTAHELHQRGDTVIVGVTSRSAMPISLAAFLPVKHRESPVEMRLVREGERWRIATP
jgi:hypothetical protein